MTDKQARFAAEYLVDCNKTQAAIRAGYSLKTAASQGERLLRKAEIRQAVDAQLAEVSEKCGVTKEWITERLRENAERALTVVPVLDRDGKEIGEYRYEGNVANRALELLGKDLKMFQDRLAIDDDSRDRVKRLLSLQCQATREVLATEVTPTQVDVLTSAIDRRFEELLGDG
jgi:phage terminase small subunit